MGIEIPAAHQAPSESLGPARIRNKNLPPPEYVPLLREYGRLGLNEFQRIYGEPTPVDDRGFVNYNMALEYIDSQVEEGYHWQMEPEVHHLLHEESLYDPRHFNADELDEDGERIDPELPLRVRENPFDKLILHGDHHDLWHVLLRPPKRPDYMHLKQRHKGSSIAISLFQHAKQVMDIEKREGQFQPIDHPHFADSLMDMENKRVIERGVLLARYIEFSEKFHAQLAAVNLDEIEDLIDTDILKSEDPMKIVVDMNAKLNLSGRKRGIKPKLRSSSQRAA
jgi:hypothetical protein